MPSMGFWQFAQQSPDKLALAAPNGRHWSRGELLSNCNRVSHGLCQLGLQPGDRVAAMMPNCAELITLNLAAIQIGCVLVPINLELSAPDLAITLADSEARVFFVHECVSLTTQMTRKMSGLFPSANCAIGNIPGFDDYQILIENQPDTMPENRVTGSVSHYIDEADSHFRLSASGYSASSPEKIAREMTRLLALFDIQPETNNVHFCGSVLHNSEVMLWAINSLHYGHPVVLAEKWDAMTMLRAIDQYKVTTSLMQPSQFLDLLEIPKKTRVRYDVSSTRHMILSAEKCPTDVKQAMTDWWGNCIYEHYKNDSKRMRYAGMQEGDQTVRENHNVKVGQLEPAAAQVEQPRSNKPGARK